MKKFLLGAILLMTLATTAVPTFAQDGGSTWVVMVGSIEKWGDEGWGGWCGAFAEIDQWAEVYAYWTRPQILPIPGNYTFYAARLAAASIIKLNYLGRDFYVYGLWDVVKVTLVYHADGTFDKVVEVIVDKAAGDLSVTGNWSVFQIAITDVPLISGTVVFYRIVFTRPIPRGDVTGEATIGVPDGEIDIYDLVHVAHAYGDSPGIGRYYFDIDFNSDYFIDIYDLATLAANLGESY